MEQTFADFEVIVSDNFVEKPCLDVVKKFDDPRIKYVKPEQPLQMAQHWEFACSHSRGKYVSVLIDKTFLHPEALAILHETLSVKEYDLVSWGNEIYAPIDESVSYSRGYYSPQYQAVGPYPFSPHGELYRRLNCELDLWAEGTDYSRGKICFGAFSSRLISRIKKAQKCLFHSVCPDYTATASALALADNAVDMGQPLMVSFLTSISNGMNYYNSPSYALNFLNQVDPSGNVLDELPVKGLYTSTHNLITGDYLRVKRSLGDELCPFSLNYENLVDRIITDLAVVGFESDEQLEAQLELLLDARPELDKAELLERIKEQKSKKPLTADRDEQEMKDLYDRFFMKFDTPLEMSKKMAEHYRAILSPPDQPTV